MPGVPEAHPEPEAVLHLPRLRCRSGPRGYYDTRPWLNGQGGDLHYLQSAAGAAGVGPLCFPGQGAQYSENPLETKQSFFSNIPQLIESPPTTTAVAGCGDAGYDVVQQGQAASGIDWNFLDSLLVHESSSASAASHPHLPC